MTDTLASVAAELGAVDPEIIRMARTDLVPRQAIEALRRTYPRAFAPAFDARTASREEYQQRKDELLHPYWTGRRA